MLVASSGRSVGTSGSHYCFVSIPHAARSLNGTHLKIYYAHFLTQKYQPPYCPQFLSMYVVGHEYQPSFVAARNTLASKWSLLFEKV